jgi:hypothetical protein
MLLAMSNYPEEVWELTGLCLEPRPVPLQAAPATDDCLESFLQEKAVVAKAALSQTALLDPKDLHGRTCREVVDCYFGTVTVPTPEDAYIAIYRLNMGLEPRTGRLAIHDGNYLNDGSIWSKKEGAVREELSRSWGVPTHKVPDLVDLVMKSLGWPSTKRCNASGKAFERCLEFLLREVGKATNLVTQYGLSKKPAIDFALKGQTGEPRRFISAKWSLRDDRILALRAEKMACRQDYPGVGMSVVTNEFDCRRINKVLEEREASGEYAYEAVYHIMPELIAVAEDVPQVFKEHSRTGRFGSLADLLKGVGVA